MASRMTVGCVGAGLLLARLASGQQVVSSTVLSEVGDVDKAPRVSGGWVAWTKADTTTTHLDEHVVADPSDGVILVYNPISSRTEEVGPGFFPDIDQYALPAINPPNPPVQVVRLAYLRPNGSDPTQLDLVSALKVLPSGDWTEQTIASALADARHVRVRRDVTVWTAPDALGWLRVRAHVEGQGGSPALLSATGVHAFRPEIDKTTPPAGIADFVVVWDEYRGSPGALDYEVFTSSASVSSPTVWSAAVNLSDSPSADFAAALAPDPDGAMWFTWLTDQDVGEVNPTYGFRAAVLKRTGSTNSIPKGHDANGVDGLVDFATTGVRSISSAWIQIDPEGRAWLFAHQINKNFDKPYNKQLLFGYYEDDTWVAPDDPLDPGLGQLTPGLLTINDRDELALDLDLAGRDIVCVYQINKRMGGVTPDSDVQIEKSVVATAPGPVSPTLLSQDPPSASPRPYDAPALPPTRLMTVNNEQWRLLFADLHSHTNQSPDGVGALDFAIFWARDVVKMDAWASTDHDLRGNHAYLDYEYAAARRLIERFDTGTFTAFLGFEYTNDEVVCSATFGMGGDVECPGSPLFGTSDTVGHHATFSISRLYRYNDPAYDDMCEYLDAMLADPDDPIGVRHHLDLLGMASFANACFDNDVQPITEIASVHGQFEATLASKMRPDPLGDGKRFGVTCAGDDHSARPGVNGLAAFWVLDQVGGQPVSEPRDVLIKDAARLHRTYGVRFEGMAVDFRLQVDALPGTDYAMGSEVEVDAGADITVSYEIADFPFGPNQFITVSLVDLVNQDYTNPTIYQFSFNSLSPVTDSTVLTNITESMILMLRVTSGDNNVNAEQTRCWTTPIWIDLLPGGGG